MKFDKQYCESSIHIKGDIDDTLIRDEHTNIICLFLLGIERSEKTFLAIIFLFAKVSFNFNIAKFIKYIDKKYHE